MPCASHSFGAPKASQEYACCICEGFRLALHDRRKVEMTGGLPRRKKAAVKQEPHGHDDFMVPVKDDQDAAQWVASTYRVSHGEFHASL